MRLSEQADRWTWLVVAAYPQLRLPWERRLEAGKLTPYRVRRAFSSVRPLLATPASRPKPCGRAPGRPKGHRSQPAPLCPVLKKAA